MPTLVMPVEDSRIELHTNDVSTTLACHSLIDYPVGVGFIARGCPGGLDNYCSKREKDSIVLPRHADLGLAGPWLGGAMKLQCLFYRTRRRYPLLLLLSSSSVLHLPVVAVAVGPTPTCPGPTTRPIPRHGHGDDGRSEHRSARGPDDLIDPARRRERRQRVGMASAVRPASGPGRGGGRRAAGGGGGGGGGG